MMGAQTLVGGDSIRSTLQSILLPERMTTDHTVSAANSKACTEVISWSTFVLLKWKCSCMFSATAGKKLCPLLGLQRSGGFKSSTKRLSTQKGTTNFYLLWTSKQLPVSIKAPKPASVKFQQCEITVCVTAVFALGTQPAPELHIPATSALLFPGLCPWMQRWSF